MINLYAISRRILDRAYADAGTQLTQEELVGILTEVVVLTRQELEKQEEQKDG